MRISKAFFSVKALLLGLALAVPALAVNEGAFYEKEHIRGFIGIGADYRGMNSEYAKYVNNLIYGRDKGYVATEARETKDAEGNTTVDTVYQAATFKGYSKFDDYYIGTHVNVGAQYRQFMTWFDINFMPFAYCEEGSGKYDACWFNYGMDWMFGWKLLGENSVFNIIPAVGFGFNFLNIHFTDNYDVVGYGGKTGETFDASLGTSVGMENRYYTAFNPTINLELEARLEIDPISIGAYLGYRWIRWDELDIEGSTYGEHDVKGDTWFLGLRLTWTFLSPWQQKQQDRL